MAWKVHNLSDLFSEKEKKDFLIKRGFNVIEFDTWYSQNEYHNKVSFHDSTTLIAYKEDIPQEIIDRNEHHSVESEIGIDRVFTIEMKKKMLFE